MPKSKRRKSKKNKKKVRFVESRDKTETVEALPKSRWHSVQTKLYSNKLAGLFQLLTVLPFFIGSWISGGFILERFAEFIVFTAALLLINFSSELQNSEKMVFKRELHLITAALLFAICLYLYTLTQLPALMILVALSFFLHRASIVLELENVNQILLRIISLIAVMCVYSLAGVLLQQYSVRPNLEWEYMVFGLVPGTVLAGALVAIHSKTFLKSGWKRSKTRVTKKNVEIQVPSGLTRLFSFLMITGPVIPTILTPFDYFPTPFLASALAFYALPQLLEAFLKGAIDDQLIAFKAGNLALGLCFVTFAAGICARLGIM